MLNNFAHEQGDNDPTTQIVLVEQRWIDNNSVTLDESFDQPDQLGEQVIAVALPSCLHLVKDIAGGRKNDLLSAEALAQFLKVDLSHPRDVGFAFQDWS